MDLISDELSDGRTLRTINVIDEYSREAFGIEVDLSLPSVRVIRIHGKLSSGVASYQLCTQNEWLDLHDFESVEHAQNLATHWQWPYNNDRPNTAVGGLPPRHFQIAA